METRIVRCGVCSCTFEIEMDTAGNICKECWEAVDDKQANPAQGHFIIEGTKLYPAESEEKRV